MSPGRERGRPRQGSPESSTKTTCRQSIPWPLTAAVLDRRRAARELDQLLDCDDRPDLDVVYPRVALREVA